MSEKIKFRLDSTYIDCTHDGCSGGEAFTLLMHTPEGTILADHDGGCFGSHYEDPSSCITHVLKLLGYEVEHLTKEETDDHTTNA